MNNWSNIPRKPPKRVFTLRDSSFAAGLFITAVSYFDLFSWLNESPADLNIICTSLGIRERSADVMLTLFKAYRFVKEKNKRYYLSDFARDYLTEKADFDLTSYVSSLKDRPICKDMIQVLQTGKPANWAVAKEGKQWAASMADDDFAASFTAGMNSRGTYLARGMLKAVNIQGYRNLLDIGGGSGIYPAVLSGEYPDLRATIFEKPPVDKIAKYSVNKFGLADRINVLTGDMFHDSFPKGYDIHFVSNILHDWDLKEVKGILRNSFQSLNSGGMIMIHDAHINKAKTGPISVAEYSVLLMFL